MSNKGEKKLTKRRQFSPVNTCKSLRLSFKRGHGNRTLKALNRANSIHTENQPLVSPQGGDGGGPADQPAQREVSLLPDDQQDLQGGDQEHPGPGRGRAQRGAAVRQRRGGVLL